MKSIKVFSVSFMLVMLLFSSVVFAQTGDSTNVVYKNCTEANEAGAFNLREGDPGYDIKHDGNDKDGIICEGDEGDNTTGDTPTANANCEKPKESTTTPNGGVTENSTDSKEEVVEVACEDEVKASIYLDEERKNISYVGRDKFIELTSVKKNWKDYNIQSQLKKEKVVQVQEHSVPPIDNLIPDQTVEQPILPPNGLMPSPTVPPTQ